MLVVTGANGFLGAHVVMSLLLKGFKVTALRRSNSDMSEYHDIARWRLKDQQDLLSNVSWMEADITDILQLDAAFEGAEYVFHCAAVVAFKGKNTTMMKVNAEGTANVVNACLKTNVKKLIYASSTAALGRTDNNKTITEDTQWADDDNNTEYAVSKHLAELEVWRGMEEGLDVFVVNPGIILGAGKWDKGSCRLFYNIKNGFKLYTQGVNGFVGVIDVAEAMTGMGMSEVKNKRFLMVAENMSYKQLFDLIANALKVKAPSIEIKPSYLFWMKWPVKIYTRLNPKSTISFETLKTSLKKNYYDSKAIKDAGFTFTPIQQVVKDTAAHL
jgi:nucleoside-diphosphate-sugar epimerase